MILVVAAVTVVVAADLGLLLKLLRCLSVGLSLAQRVPGGGRRRRAAVGRRHDDAELVEKRLRLRVGETLSSEHLLDPVAVRSREVLLDQALERKKIVSAVANFKCHPATSYPCSIEDKGTLDC